ncbi:macro domain-containing protein [Rhizobium sp. CFBP 8762]|uniref:macro domain-containing protein n=1 Tax=Rhizobium sp. CFBP 8762 TaxID=2775279 RepID=UPI0017870642|nr:macro domain-containing protein [Rhizobium sp. CFBP 8762]MBD8555438.1 macro domain-containing protein [Rhizobium sp. CFBP 8762]
MLVYRRTDLFSSPAQTLVNTVNCVGVMGKGIAKEFKQRDPDMFDAYKRLCDQKLLAPGKLWLWRGEDYLALNFPTKIQWKSPSKLEWVEAGLKKFAASYADVGIEDISFPRLGCGNGGLDWEDVRPLMERYLKPLPINIYIHDYTVDVGLPEHLESVASSLKTTKRELSFESFLADITRAVDLSGDNLIDLVTEKQIQAHIVDENLRIDTDYASLTFERDDLRSAWIRLVKGLLTKDNLGEPTEGSPLLSLFSVLPQVRPIEIRRPDESAPELAVELTPGNRSTSITPQPRSGQMELSWH